MPWIQIEFSYPTRALQYLKMVEQGKKSFIFSWTIYVKMETHSLSINYWHLIPTTRYNRLTDTPPLPLPPLIKL